MLQDDLVYASLLGASIALGPYTQRISDFRQRQLVLTALGFILVVSVSGWHVFHPLVLVGANIALSQTRYYYISSFAFSFFYLFLTRTAAWWGLPSPPAHTNAVLMILVLKLVGLSWEVHESESKNPPSFVNYFHYSFCLPGVLTGPYFKYSTYKAMLQAPYLHHVPWRAHLQERLLPVPLYLILFLAASYIWPLEHPTRPNGVFQRISSPDQLSELTVWDRLFYMTPVFFAFRMRLYMGFVLGECSCIASKLGAFPEVSKPEAGRGPADLEALTHFKSHPELWTSARYNFEAVRNIDEWGSEALPTIQGGIRSWNRTVQYWLASLVYRPLQPYCSKALRTLVTMLVSSFWHGVYPGYYLCLLSAPFFLLVEAKVLRAFGHLAAFRFFWWVFKMQAFAYMGMAFLLLHLTPTLQYWLSIGFVGHLLLPIFYLAACLASRT